MVKPIDYTLRKVFLPSESNLFLSLLTVADLVIFNKPSMLITQSVVAAIEHKSKVNKAGR
jgi:hypothetical protein